LLFCVLPAGEILLCIGTPACGPKRTLAPIASARTAPVRGVTEAANLSLGGGFLPRLGGRWGLGSRGIYGCLR
jgi:hypothetical protein